MRRLLCIFMMMCAVFSLRAQESRTTYNFLRLPVSAHAGALGGDNISVIEDDASLIFHNPSLLASVSDKTILLNYMNYMSGANTASAAFVKVLSDRTTVAASAQYLDFGKISRYDADNISQGEFSAKDISISGYFSYTLFKNLVGGISAKFITSSIASYTSMGVAVDLGLNYFNSSDDLSLSFVVKNLGGQLKAYDDDFEKLPIDVQVGATKRLQHTPLRFSLSLVDLNNWNYRFFNHVVAGVDILLSHSVWIGAGYNFKRAHDMKINGADEGRSAHGAGMSFGAGLNLDRFGLNISYGKYHVASSSILLNVSYRL